MYICAYAYTCAGTDPADPAATSSRTSSSDSSGSSVDSDPSGFIAAGVCVCVCVCVRERESARERASETVYLPHVLDKCPQPLVGSISCPPVIEYLCKPVGIPRISFICFGPSCLQVPSWPASPSRGTFSKAYTHTHLLTYLGRTCNDGGVNGRPNTTAGHGRGVSAGSSSSKRSNQNSTTTTSAKAPGRSGRGRGRGSEQIEKAPAAA